MSTPTSWPLALLPQRWMLYRLPPDAPWPPEVRAAPWAFLARTSDEVSLLLPEDVPAPKGSRAQGPWRGLRIATTLDFSLVGVLAALSQVLAAAGVPLLAVSTYDTDYFFVPAADLEVAVEALQQAGHRISEETDAR